jgi:O-Antigen ligase
MSALARRRRTYVAPHRSLVQRLQAAAPPVPSPLPSVLLAAGVALAIVLCAFGAQGGSQLVRTTWTEVGLLLAGAALFAAALLTPGRPETPVRLRGAGLLGAFAALAALTALSIKWSRVPGDSWQEADRTLAYLAALAAGVALARLAPSRWGAMLAGVTIAAVVICGWALLTKVFPAALAPDEPYARLRPPFDYWNSVGLAAALGVPGLLWLGARRSGHAALNALAWPGLGLLLVCLMLAYSRGALLAMVLGIGVWLCIVPLRLRSAALLLGVTAATAPVVAWAFAQDGLTLDNPPIALRVAAGHELGALLLLLMTALLIAGIAVGFLGATRPPGAAARARASRALIAALLAVPAVAILMLANAPGGIDGQVSKAWTQATNPDARTPPNDPSRFTATSSVRSRYWREAAHVHAASPWLGSGADAYGTLRLRYRTNLITVRHAHSYVMQTLADLGWVGLGVSLLAAGAWLVATIRALGLRPRDRGLPWDAERVALAAMSVVVVIFGIHSAIDWTWFVPANAVAALLCTGFVAARGPLRERLGLGPPPAERVQRVWRRAPLAVAAAAIALVTCWGALQPVRASHAEAEAFTRLDEGQLPAAISIAQIAHERDPLAVEPLFDIASMQQAAGDNEAAGRALNDAVALEPATAETWRRLGDFRLNVLHDAKGAQRAYGAALYLDPKSPQSQSDVIVAARAASGG